MDLAPPDRPGPGVSRTLFAALGALALVAWFALAPGAGSAALALLVGWIGFVLLRTAGGVANGSDPAGEPASAAGEVPPSFEQVPAGLWTTDRELRVLSARGLAFADAGTEAAALVGRPVPDLFGEDDGLHPAVDAHRRALTGEAVRFEESRGEHVHQVAVGPRRAADGTVEGVVGVRVAISERVREEELLRSLVAGIATRTGRECLRSLVRHLGLRLGVRHVCVVECQGERLRSLAAWSSEGEAPALEQALVGSICQGIEPGEWRHAERGARHRFPEDPHLARLGVEGACAIGLASSHGRPGALLVVDVAPLPRALLERASLGLFAERAAAELEREHVVQALTRSERQARLLAENLPGVVYLRRADEDSTSLFLGEGILELTGHGPEAFLAGSLTLRGLCHPEDLPRVQREVDEALAAERPFQLRYRLRHADGRWLEVEERGEGLCVDGREVLVEGFLWDVSERAVALRDRGVLLEQVLGSRATTGAGVLADDRGGELVRLLDELRDGEATQPAAHLARARELAALLVDTGPPPEPRTVDPGRLVREFEGVLAAAAGPRAELVLEVDGNLPKVNVDPTRLRHGLLEAVERAAAASGPGGRVVLRVQRVREAPVSADLSGTGDTADRSERVRFEVVDDGPALEGERLGSLLDPCSPAARPGPAALAAIVRELGGAVGIESGPGRGTTLRFWLPAAGCDESGEPVVELLPTLLVVDDEEVVRSLAESVLEGAGYRVVAVPGGREALELLRRRPGGFQLALVDASMPGLDGRGTLEELRRLAPGLPVVLSSGYGEPEGDPPAVAAFLGKPYRPGELVETVRRVLGGAP